MRASTRLEQKLEQKLEQELGLEHVRVWPNPSRLNRYNDTAAWEGSAWMNGEAVAIFSWDTMGTLVKRHMWLGASRDGPSTYEIHGETS